MKLNTTFTCGDTAWIVCGQWGSKIEEYTVGQIRVVVTDSKGEPDSMFSNYKPQQDYVEEIMCVETGVGSGSVYTVGKHAFKTRDEAETGQAIIQAENAEDIARQKAWNDQQRQKDIEFYQREIARLTAEATK